MFALFLSSCVAAGTSTFAQNEDVPLGDVARAFRKDQEPPQKVIDNDNLPQVMDDGESKKWAHMPRLAPPRPAVQLIHFQAPNVTCALSFNANSPDLLANAPRPQRLPDSDLTKLDGPARIVDNTLELSVLNATGWDVREITVGLTIVRKPYLPTAFLGGAAKLVPAAVESPTSSSKPADLTLVYHLQGAAPPYSTAVFRQELERPLEPDEEWHWAILQAKGMPPAPIVDTSALTAQNGASTPDGEVANGPEKAAATNSSQGTPPGTAPVVGDPSSSSSGRGPN